METNTKKTTHLTALLSLVWGYIMTSVMALRSEQKHLTTAVESQRKANYEARAAHEDAVKTDPDAVLKVPFPASGWGMTADEAELERKDSLLRTLERELQRAYLAVPKALEGSRWDFTTYLGRALHALCQTDDPTDLPIWSAIKALVEDGDGTCLDILMLKFVENADLNVDRDDAESTAREAAEDALSDWLHNQVIEVPEWMEELGMEADSGDIDASVEHVRIDWY